MADVAFDDYRLVHEIAHPLGTAPVIEADFAIRIPAGMQNPAAEVLRHAGHGVGVELRTVLLDLPDFAFQSFAERFVGVEREHPIVLALLGGVILLAGESAPIAFDHARAELGGELDGAIGRAAVHHHDFVATAQAFDHARNVALLIERDNRSRDLHQGLMLVYRAT